MTGLRHRLMLERIIAEIQLDERHALIVERLESGKLAFWKCSRGPSGRPALATAARCFSVPMSALDEFIRVVAGIEAGQPSADKLRRRA